MRPLRDSPVPPDPSADRDPEATREARLLRAVAPLQPSLARMHRVRLRIEAEPRSWHALSPRNLVAAGALAAALLVVMQQRVQTATVAARSEAEAAAHHAAPSLRPATHPRLSGAAPSLGTPADSSIAAAAESPAAARPAATDVRFATVEGAPAAAAATTTTRDASSVAEGAPLPANGPVSAPAPASQLAAGTAPLLVGPAAAREVPGNLGGGPAGLEGVAPAGSGAAVAPTQGIALGAASAGSGSSVVALPASSNGPSVVRGQGAPPAPGVRRDLAGGGRGNPRFEPALLAQAATEPPRQDGITLTYDGLLDGERVSGTVALRRTDQGGHSLVIRHGADLVAEAQVLDVGPDADLTIDLDGDGLDDMRISLRPPEGSSEGELSARDTAAIVPDVGVMLRSAAP